MPQKIEQFVHRKNIEHLKRQIAQCTDEARLAILRKLLDEERAKEGLGPLG